LAVPDIFKFNNLPVINTHERSIPSRASTSFRFSGLFCPPPLPGPGAAPRRALRTRAL